MPVYFDVVDDRNQVVGMETRERIHSGGLWHRGVHILVLNSKVILLLQMRSAAKDTFPNHYDCSVSEHVERGETYEAAVIRGLKEELGISDVRFKRLLRFRMNYGSNDNMISELYECRYDGAVQVDRGETCSLETFSMSEIMDMLLKDEFRFAPWTREVIKWYLKIPSKVEALPFNER